MHTSFTLKNHTNFELKVRNVDFNTYDYWGEDGPGQLKQATLNPHSSKHVDFEAYRGANGRAFTLTLGLSDGNIFDVTGDPGKSPMGKLNIKSSQKGAYVPNVTASTGADGALVFTVRQGLPPMSCWMEALTPTQRKLPLSQLTLPGTHDSGTSTTSSIAAPKAKTQDWTIREQLQNGIRVFDIRVKVKTHMFDDPTLIIAHGEADMDISYDDVLDAFAAFLLNSKECIVMQCNQESVVAGKFDDALFDSLITKKNSNHSKLFYFPDSANDDSGRLPVPSIDDAEGKVVLLRRYPGTGGISLTDWPDDNAQVFEGYMRSNTFYVQDYSGDDIESKKTHFQEAFHYATVPDQKLWLLNFNSIAVWLMSTGTIHTYSDVMNEWLLEYVGENRLAPVTIYMDFPTPTLICQIVSQNFASSEPESVIS